MQNYYRSTKPRRVFKGAAFSGVYGRRSTAFARSRSGRASTLGALRGRVRTAGYYGRFTGSGGESKFHDKDVAIVGATAGGLDTSLNLVAQGAGESDRIGRKIVVKKLYCHWTCFLDPTATAGSTSDILRIIFYVDKQANGAAATAAQILESGGSYPYQAFRNLANVDRFTLLKDFTVALNAQGGTGASATETQKQGRFAINCNVPIEFDGATGSLTEIRSNNIGCLVLGERAGSDFRAAIRVRYTDH